MVVPIASLIASLVLSSLLPRFSLLWPSSCCCAYSLRYDDYSSVCLGGWASLASLAFVLAVAITPEKTHPQPSTCIYYCPQYISRTHKRTTKVVTEISARRYQPNQGRALCLRMLASVTFHYLQPLKEMGVSHWIPRYWRTSMSDYA